MHFARLSKPILQRSTLLLTALLLWCGSLAAQRMESDSTRSNRSSGQDSSVDLSTLSLRRYRLADFTFDTTHYRAPDTALFKVWQYDPAFSGAQYAQLGVLGSAARPLLLNTGTFSPFRMGYDQYQAYAYQAEQMDYWDVSTPLTSFHFMSGGVNPQQYFHLFHTQNIGKSVNIGAQYRLLSSDGFYANEVTNNKNLRLFASMVAPRRRYAAHLNYTTNNNLNEQNGGIQPAFLFESGVLVAPLGVPVHLNSASSRYNQRQLFGEQQFRLSGSDSSFGGLAAFHQLSVRRDYYKFGDNQPLNPYYPAVWRDSSQTRDSTAMRSIRNSIGLRSLHLLGPLQWEAALHHEALRLFSTQTAQAQQLLWTSATAQYRLSTGLRLHAEGDYVLVNTLQANTHRFLAGIRFGEKEKQWIQLQYLNQSQNPAWVSQQFFGNHQRLDNNFAPMLESAWLLDLQLPVGKVFLHNRNISRWVYFDGLGQAQQYDPTVNLLQFGYESVFKLGKFILQIHHGWQWGAEGPLRAPRFFNHDVLSFQHTFKTGWELQIGTDFRFQSAYFAPGFRPDIGQFVVQDSVSAGNYPVLDAFAAIKVKRTRIFFRMEHLNQGFPAPNFYATPLYPMYGRSFRYGLTWDFYN